MVQITMHWESETPTSLATRILSVKSGWFALPTTSFLFLQNPFSALLQWLATHLFQLLSEIHGGYTLLQYHILYFKIYLTYIQYMSALLLLMSNDIQHLPSFIYRIPTSDLSTFRLTNSVVHHRWYRHTQINFYKWHVLSTHSIKGVLKTLHVLLVIHQYYMELYFYFKIKMMPISG